jgi:hypothetical protein
MKVICRVFGIIILLPLLAYSQVQDRIIDFPARTQSSFVKGEDGKMVTSNIEALEIVEIRVGDKTVLLGQSFSAGDDWLKNLTVRVKNISGKPISSIRMHFGLPGAKYKEGTMGFSLEYGKALSTGIDYGVQKSIIPNEELVLFRNEAHYNRDRNGIAQKAGVINFSEVLIGVTTVRFEDGMVWSGWRLPTVDQSN